MVIAVLALLGVNLVVIVVFVGSVLARKRWVNAQPGVFRGAIRLEDGELDGIAPKWRRGYGHWVRDVLVWTRGPFLFRNELLPADGVEGQRLAAAGEVKRLGDNPTVSRVRVGSATVEVATQAQDSDRVFGPFRQPLARS
jgi:hypothetical protein